MQHGGFASNDWPSSLQYYRVAVLGQGAAAPVAPTDGLIQPLFPKSCNAISRVAAEIPTRSGTGAYVVTIDPSFKLGALLMATAEVYGATGMWAQVSAISAANRTLTIKVFNASGAATDLASGTDLLVIDVCGRDSGLA